MCDSRKHNVCQAVKKDFNSSAQTLGQCLLLRTNEREEKQLVFTGNRKLETSALLRSSFHCVSEQF